MDMPLALLTSVSRYREYVDVACTRIPMGGTEYVYLLLVRLTLVDSFCCCSIKMRVARRNASYLRLQTYVHTSLLLLRVVSVN